jgi:membrane protease YdiL (CAAX protease family)
MSLQTGGADGPGRIVRLLVLVIPFALGQLVLQGGEHLSGPYLAHLHELALVDPDAAELRYIAVVLGVLTGTQLVLGASAVLIGGLRPVPHLRDLVGQIAAGASLGVPLGAVVYFVLWWVDSTVGSLAYSGAVGHAWGWFVPLGTAVGALGGVCEEIYFRGALHRGLSGTVGVRTAWWLNLSLFCLWHPNAYGDLTYMLVLVGMGAVYLWLASTYDSVVPAATTHVAVNVVSMTLANT